MIPLTFSITLLGFLTLAVFLGIGQRVLDHLRMSGSTASVLLLLMIAGHFLPTVPLGPRLALNLGVIVPFGVVLYLLVTASKVERWRSLAVGLLTGLLILLSDKLLPPDPGVLDPLYSAGLFAGVLSELWSRSRRNAFIAAIIGIFSVDLANFVELKLKGVGQQTVLGSGGLLSSIVVSSFLAVVVAELIGEIRERIQRKLQQ